MAFSHRKDKSTFLKIFSKAGIRTPKLEFHPSTTKQSCMKLFLCCWKVTKENITGFDCSELSLSQSKGKVKIVSGVFEETAD